MARMPGTEWLGEHGSATMSRYDIVCIHTIVGYAPAHAAHFSTRANGWIGQSRDTRFRSAANTDGNPRIIAIENEDFGSAYGSWSGSNVPGFTAEQCESIARICAWAHATHGVPLVLCPDSRPGSRGIGYHRQGIDGNFGSFAFPGRVPGGELWTASFGKVCPGDRRIRQLIDIIIPRARIIAGLDTAPKDDMELTDKVRWWDGKEVELGDLLAALYVNTNRLVGKPPREGDPVEPVAWVSNLFAAVAAIESGNPTDEQLDNLTTELRAALGPVVAEQLGRWLLRPAPAQ